MFEKLQFHVVNFGEIFYVELLDCLFTSCHSFKLGPCMQKKVCSSLMADTTCSEVLQLMAQEKRPTKACGGRIMHRLQYSC